MRKKKTNSRLQVFSKVSILFKCIHKMYRHPLIYYSQTATRTCNITLRVFHYTGINNLNKQLLQDSHLTIQYEICERRGQWATQLI